MMPKQRLLLIFSAIILGIEAKSKFIRDPAICGRPICKDPLKFNFEPTVRYKYKYSVRIKTIFDGAGSNSSDILINSEVDLNFITPCEGILSLSNSEIYSGFVEPTEKDEERNKLFDASLSENVIRFSFEDGVIKEVCPFQNESISVLNFKKGLLSSLQNTMHRFDVEDSSYERDINGDCLTGYYFKEVNGTTLVITKKIDLKSCVNRQQIYSIIPMTPYVFQKKYHKWSPLNSTVVCSHYIDHKIYKGVTCEEYHLYHPFHNETNGARTIAHSSLMLTEEEKMWFSESERLKRIGKVEARTNLLFDHRRPKRITHNDLFNCKILLKSLCELHEEKYKPIYPDKFNSFIHIARDLSRNALGKLYTDSLTICPTGRKHMLDALPYIRSRASIQLMTDVILSTEVPQETARDLLLVMAFSPRPDYEMIESVSKLITLETSEKETMLALSSMIHGYCEGHGPCDDVKVKKIVERIESQFNSTCTASKHTEQEIIALKSIGNAGVLTHTLESSLAACIGNDALSQDIRILAIQAQRRLRCETNKDLLIKIFRNHSADEELRIESYLQLMKCPTYSSLKAIRDVLEKEVYNQVGSFIWSHLQTQMKSSLPSRMEIQAMLQDEELNDKFDKDFRSFSKSYESSFYLNSIGIGGFVETNVIFTHNSYIPRSVMMNVTVAVFGELVNIGEMFIRLEGVEKYAEKLFFGEGVFSRESFEKVMKLVRVIRSEPNPLKHFINQIPFKKILDSIKVSASIKVFGNELKYYSINSHDEFVSVLEDLNPVKIINHFLTGKNINYDRSTMLIDASYITPMSNGIPLKLNAIGTAAINLDAMGLINTNNFTKTGKLDLAGKFSPSTGVNFEGSMEVDTFIARTGVKFKASVFTSTAVEGRFELDSYKLVRTTFHLPMSKSDIFHAETQLLIIVNDREETTNGITAGRHERSLCTWSLLDEIIGLKMCAQTLLPNSTFLLESPLYLFSGPLKFEVFLEKSDPSAKIFIIEYRMESFKNKSIIMLKLDTPGSLSKRGMRAEIDLDTQTQNLTLVYESTRSQLKAQGYYRNTANEKLLDFGLDINGKKHIDMHIGITIQDGKYGNTYSPSLEFSINGKKIASFGGSIKSVSKKGISQCHIDLKFDTNNLAAVITGYLRMSEASFATNMKIDYRFTDSKDLETVRIELKLGNKSTKFLTYYNGEVQLESSAYPAINMVTSMKLQRAQSHIDCYISMFTNPFVEDEAQKLRMTWSYQQYKSAFALDKLNTSLVIVKPVSNLDLKFGIIKHDTPTNTTTTVLIRYAKGKEIAVNFDVNMPHGTLLFFESKLIVTVPAAVNRMSLFSKIYEKAIREYDVELIGTWFSGHNVSIRGMYQDKSTLTLLSHSLKLLSRSQLFNDILFIGKIMNSETEYRTEVQLEHNDIQYGVNLKHASPSLGQYETFGEVLYNKTSYSFNNFIDVERKRSNLEMHFDRFRDVHIALHGNSNKSMIDAGMDLKYDANRDPSQKVTVLINVNSLGTLNQDGKLIMEYPGRTITTLFFLEQKYNDYILSFKLDWSPTDAIVAYLHGTFDLSENGFAKFVGKIETPFKKWENLGLNFQMKVENQNFKSNGSLIWHDNQRLDADVSFYYVFVERNTVVSFSGILNSGISEVNSMKLIFNHNQKPSEFSTEILLQTSPNYTISVGCSGGILRSAQLSQYNGSFQMATPFAAVKRVSLNGDMEIQPEKFEGKLRVIGNGKKYTTSVKGYMRIITESLFIFQMETPFEKYKAITGKMTLSATNRTFFADLKSCVSCISPASLGGELIYNYQNLSKFNLKLEVHSSISFVKKLLIVGQRDTDAIDARFFWNAFMVGLTGRSHYSSFKDMEYGLKLYLPIGSYQTAAATVKIILEDKIDFEASVNLATKKVGLKIQAMRSPGDEFAVPELSIVEEEGNITVESNTTLEIREEPEGPQIEPLALEEIYFGDIYWRGYLQLDTPMYPTVQVLVQVVQEDATDFTTISYVNFPFVKLRLTDSLYYLDLLNIRNEFSIKSTCNCAETVSGSFSLEGILGRQLKTDANFLADIYNYSYGGLAELSYNFEPSAEENLKEGQYRLSARVETPFQLLKQSRVDIHFLVETPIYGGNATIVVNNSTIVLDGTLESDVNYFTTEIGVKIFAPVFLLPMSRLYVYKDFTDFEKKLEIGLALPNERGNALVHYGIGGIWHYDGPNFFRCAIDIVTPYANIGTLKGSVQYVREPSNDHYFLEGYAKFSNTTEIKATCSILTGKVNFKIESTYEGFKKINMDGTLEKKNEVKSLKAVLSSDKEYKMVGHATLIPNKPLMIEVQLFRASTNEELINIILTINKTTTGYEISSLIQKNGKRINIECDYSLPYAIGRKVDLRVDTTYPGYKSLSVNAILLNDGYHVIMYQAQGHINSNMLTTDVRINGSLSFEQNGGIINLDLLSPKLRGDIEIMWTMVWFENIYLDIDGSGSYGNLTKEFSTHFHVWNNHGEFQQISVGANVNFGRNNTWLSANTTMLWPVWNNFRLFTHAVLPNKMDEPHSALVQFHYNKNFTYGSHVIKYASHPQKFNFLTASEISVQNDSTKGAMLLKTGKHRIHNSFKLVKINTGYDITNLLQSTNMKQDLTVKLLYKHPSIHRHVRLLIFYPLPTPVLEATVKFEAINNFSARMNCSTPFPAFPRIKLLVDVVTSTPLYLRYIHVSWLNNSALFNYTHASQLGPIQLTDGVIHIEFPLATRHIGLLKYKYESTDSKATGHSSLFFNNNTVMNGNYTRSSEITPKTSKDNIEVQVDNSFMPAILTYNHRVYRRFPQRAFPFTEIKILEMSKLNNKSAFHFIGEYKIDQESEFNKLVTLRGMHSTRILEIKSFSEGKEKIVASANFTLKPELSFGSGFEMIHKDIGKTIDFNVSYPRRNFELNMDYALTVEHFNGKMTVYPNKYKEAMSVSGEIDYANKLDGNGQQLTLIVAHPTFEKNITFSSEFSKHDNYLVDMNSTLEYSTDENKKLSVSGRVTDLSRPHLIYYDMQIDGSHPASRLKINMIGYVRAFDKLFEFDKNITYSRSYLPTLWFAHGKVDTRDKLIEIEKKSMRDTSYLIAKYGKYHSRHYLNSNIINGDDTRISSDFYVDTNLNQIEMTVNFTPDASERLRMLGWFRENRHMILNVWRAYDSEEVHDITFYTTLNHSRLLSMSLIWRPEMRSDLIEFLQSYFNYAMNYAVDTANFLTTYLKSEALDSMTDIWIDARPIVQDFLEDVKDYRELQDDIDWFKELFTEAYEANEFFMQDIYKMYLVFAEEMSFKDKMAHVPKIINELYEAMGETGETVRESILYLIESVKKMYNRVIVFFKELMSGETINKISDYLKKMIGKYDKMAKDVHISFMHYMEHLLQEASNFVSHYWFKTLTTIEPAFIQFAHYLESAVLEGSKKTLEFLYEKQSEFLKNSVLNQNSNFTKDLDKFYEDIMQNDFLTNVRKYLKMMYDMFTEKYLQVIPFGTELNKIGSEIIGEVTELRKLPFFNFTIEITKDIYGQVEWFYNYFQIKSKIMELIPIIYRTIVDFRHTALDNEMINHAARTRFVFEPSQGKIILDQKLPVPWHAFNETPNYEEISEYKALQAVQEWFTPSNKSILSTFYYYYYAPFSDPFVLFPPFDAQALIIGNKHFMTFDGRNYEFSGGCSYLLANDFVGKTFSLVLKHTIVHGHVLALLVGGRVIIVDLHNNEITLENEPSLHLPLQIDDLFITANEGVASIRSRKGFELHCNFKYDVCTFGLSGKYFGKTAGLLGTLDNEPYTDFTSSQGVIVTDVDTFIQSWSLDECLNHGQYSGEGENSKNAEFCHNLYEIKTSSFASCYGVIDPSPFQDVCLRSFPEAYDDEICTSAQAYIKACKKEYIPMKIPSYCVECSINNVSLEEGDVITLDRESILQSTDVIFIIEAKKCNEYMREKRMVHIFVSILTKELENVELSKNRFGVITFGGDGVFDQPQSIVVNNNIFTSEKYLARYFEKIESGNGNTDIFGALKFATKLHFRPGVSKTFILLPCSDCDLRNMTVEYNVLNQVFITRNITLHVLMDADFDVEKLRVSKIFYGLDSERAFTKNDFKVLKGDTALRRQIKLTKSMMGYCTSLALATNGTIFTGKKMESENMALVKKFSSVFARRIASTAQPDECQNCECSTDENGIDFVECSPCSVPIPAYSEFDLRDNNTLPFLHAFEHIGGDSVDKNY